MLDSTQLRALPSSTIRVGSLLSSSPGCSSPSRAASLLKLRKVVRGSQGSAWYSGSRNYKSCIYHHTLCL